MGQITKTRPKDMISLRRVINHIYTRGTTQIAAEKPCPFQTQTSPMRLRSITGKFYSRKMRFLLSDSEATDIENTLPTAHTKRRLSDLYVVFRPLRQRL